MTGVRFFIRFALFGLYGSILTIILGCIPSESYYEFYFFSSVTI